MMYVLLIVGFILLIKGADWFVDGASSLASILKVPGVVIGLTIVALGTSAPEASVSLSAAIAGSNDIALSNVIGSNMFNTLVVVGMSGIIAKFAVHKDILKRDMPLNILATALLFLFVLNGTLGRLEGLIFAIGIIAYMAYMVYNAKKHPTQEDDDVKKFSLPISLLLIAIGLVCVIFGGDLVVDNAVLIAQSLNVSQNLIALTIIAIGTSLPELVTSIVASRKGHSDLALGNAIGSNLFNILFILGFSSFIHPLHVASETMVDVFILLLVGLIVYIFSRSKQEISKKEGLIMVLLYVVYTAYLLVR